FSSRKDYLSNCLVFGGNYNIPEYIDVLNPLEPKSIRIVSDRDKEKVIVRDVKLLEFLGIPRRLFMIQELCVFNTNKLASTYSVDF
ncbi:MAG: hypothetical protein OXI86_15690, partial [Candidatus Poribacteria bacterium]|nr:hypothetical protein [Candidatus Poribacteria bacterium]